MTKVLLSIVTAVALIAILILFSGNTEEPVKPKGNIEAIGMNGETVHINGVNQEINQPPIPSYLTFAGEEVPLHVYDVRERLDRELLVNTYYHSKTMQILKLANRHFKDIEPILAERDIPDDFKYVAMAESGLIHAISPMAAVGMWQIRKNTAQEFGLEVANEVDERYHLEKSTVAACKYFQRAHNKFKNWTMACGSYNMGMAGIAKQAKNQKESNYYDLYLNDETSRYVFRVLAFKLIYENPENYGFYLNQEDLYPPVDHTIVEVTKIDDIADFAKSYGTNYKLLKLLNPWLRSTAVEPRRNGKVYQVKIPQ